MIISRTPLRISIGGGGTDLPSFYQDRGGFVIAAAITKYVYVAVNRTFTDDYFLKYSEIERADDISEIKHPIIKRAFERLEVDRGIELVSMADIPAGTGLGSSGSFTVGLLNALYAYKRQFASVADLAAQASEIEMVDLGQPIGKQDQYIAAFGDIIAMELHQDGSVAVRPLAASEATLRDLEENLIMFFTGYSRTASGVLADQKTRTNAGDSEMISNLQDIKRMGKEIEARLEDGDCVGFGKLMHEHWVRKRERSPGMSNSRIDEWYQLGLSSGAVGGKLVGAGQGGFLMFYCTDRESVRTAMASANLSEVRFGFDHSGSVITER